MRETEREAEEDFGCSEGESTAENPETLSPDERGDDSEEAPPDFHEPKEP